MTSRNIVITSCTPWIVVSRSSLMALIITFMLEPAKLQTNCASASGTSTARALSDPGSAACPAVAMASLARARPADPVSPFLRGRRTRGNRTAPDGRRRGRAR